MAKKFFTLESLTTLIDEIKSYVVSAVSGKADTSHSHSISNVTNLQSSLDAKVPITRKINGKVLNTDITITASDVGAASSTHSHNDIYYTETEVDTKLASKSDSTHNHDSAYDAKGSAEEAFSSAKTYVDDVANKVKNDLLNGAGGAYDTLKELGDLIDDNKDAIEALETIASSKADKDHNHDDKYYTETEIDNMVFITVDDIDVICGTTIQIASEVTF